MGSAEIVVKGDECLEAKQTDNLARLWRCTTDYSPVPTIVTEGQMQIVRYANPAFCRLAGQAVEDLLGRPFAEAVPEGAENGCGALLDGVYSTKRAENLADQRHAQLAVDPVFWSYVAWALPRTELCAAMVIVQVTNTTEAVLFRHQVARINQELLVSSVRQHELTEAAAVLNGRLESMATTDGLTGIKNHRAFQERIAEEVGRAHRYKTPLSLLFLDVDDFKNYNDIYGHPAGDSVLRRIAEVLHATARTHDLVARYGGEEFAVILTDTAADAARTTGERIRAAIEATNWPYRQMTISLGAATLSPTDDAATLIAQADRAMYRSKHNGRNCVTHFADVMDAPHTIGHKPTPSPPMTPHVLESRNAATGASMETVKHDLQRSYDAMIACWVRLINFRDEGTQNHSVRVAEMMARLAHQAGMSEEEVVLAKRGALLHDIGKIMVPSTILNKPGPLTGEEETIMQSHPVNAAEMLSPVSFMGGPAIDIPQYHHERWDGSGYPYGLKGEEIPLAARLFAVIDVYDALISDRPYRKAWSESSALRYLKSEMGTHLDPHAVNAFVALLDQHDKS